MEKSKKNVVLPDTNVLINDPFSVLELIKGDNLLVIAKTVILELDNLKRRPETKNEARMALRNIYNLQKEKSENLLLLWELDFSNLKLYETVPDHQVLAAFNFILNNQEFSGYDKYKLISEDSCLLLIGNKLFSENKKVEIGPYKHSLVKKIKKPSRKPIKIKAKEYNNGAIIFSNKKFAKISNNSSVLLEYEALEFLAIRKGNFLVPVDLNISVSNIRALDNGVKNWQQRQYIYQLLDNDIKTVLVSGPAGSGKTLLALAAALELKDSYKQIVITKTTTNLEDRDELGFLPGDVNSKMSEYIVPYLQDLEVIVESNAKHTSFLKKNFKKNSVSEIVEGIRNGSITFSSLGIKVNSLQYYRGRTYHDSLLIVDEAQNLSSHQIKTILTRIGKNSKIILIGDLDQIDRKYINNQNSGLAYAMSKMEGNPMVGVTVLTEGVRSEISAFAEKVL